MRRYVIRAFSSPKMSILNYFGKPPLVTAPIRFQQQPLKCRSQATADARPERAVMDNRHITIGAHHYR